MIRVLHVIGAMDRAGAETILMNLYRTIDRTQVQFDFLVHAKNKCAHDDEIESLGGKIYRIPFYNVINMHGYRRAVREFFEEHPEHPIVHGHIGSSAPVYIEEASRQGRYTIAHSHSDSSHFSPSHAFFKLIASPVRGKADYYMACSQESGIDRFGSRIVSAESFSILNNGIKVSEFTRDADAIKAAKAAFGFGEEPIFGHVGRLTNAKNQSFLLDVFSKIKRRLPAAKLMLVGKGEDEAKLKSKAAHLGISEDVLFLGVIPNVPDALRAMDVFVFPSVSEGLGMAIIEAQSVGLQCIASTEVHDIAIITDRAKRMPLGNAQEWAEECIRAYERSKDNQDSLEDEVTRAGFGIEGTARWLQDFYLEHAAEAK